MTEFAITGAALNPTTQEVIAVYCSLLANIISRKQAEVENAYAIAAE